MFEPDLSYYLRAVRSRWKHVLVAGILGALIGILLAGVNRLNSGWTATQRLEMSEAATFLTSGDLPTLELPGRQAADEASYVRLVAELLEENGGLTVVGDDASRTLKLVTSAARRSEAERKLSVVVERYVADRIAEYDSYFDVLERTLGFQRAALTDSVAALDALAAGASPTESVSAQAVVAQRSEIISEMQEVDGAMRMVADLRDTQTGGVVALDDPKVVKTQTVVSGLPVVTALCLLGLLVGVIVAMLQKSGRRSIESEKDLSLFPSLVTVGALESINPAILAKLTQSDRVAEHTQPRYVVTESLVGLKGRELLDRLEAAGLSVAQRSCLDLAHEQSEPETEQGVILAVDRSRDTERSILDVVTILDHSRGPLFAVLC